MGFVDNYAPYGLSPQTDGIPVIPQKPRPQNGQGHTPTFFLDNLNFIIPRH